MEWFGLKRTLEGHLVQSSCNEQGHPQLYQVAQSFIWPDLGYFQGYIKLCLQRSKQAHVVFLHNTPDSYHLFTSTCTGASSAPGRLGTHSLTSSPSAGPPSSALAAVRPSQTGQNLPTSACKNRTGSILSFREQHSLYRKRDLTVFWLVEINNKQQNS